MQQLTRQLQEIPISKFALITKVVDGVSPVKSRDMNKIQSQSQMSQISEVQRETPLKLSEEHLTQIQVEYYCDKFNLSVQELFEARADYHSITFGASKPITIEEFCKNASVINQKHPMVQQLILKAAGLAHEAKTVDWNVYLRLAAHIKYRTVSHEEQIAFWMQVINPENKKVIRADNFKLLMEQLTSDTDVKDKLMTTEFLRQLTQKLTQFKVMDYNSNDISTTKLEAAMREDLVSVKAFEQLLYPECEFNVNFKS